MEKLATGIGILALGAAAYFLLILIAPVFGYIVGWFFGIVFDDTWSTMHAYMRMPANLTSGMFGAFLAQFGAMLGSRKFVGKDKK